MSNFLGNVAGAAFSTDVFDPNDIIANDADDLLSVPITLVSGQNLARGAVLGRIKLAASASVVATRIGSSNGTLVMDSTTPILPNAVAGAYDVECTATGSNTSTWSVTDPFGEVIGADIIQAGGAGGTVTFANAIKFVITDGSTDFSLGDKFTVTIAAGSAKYKLAALAAVDGSADPNCILAMATDASGGDKRSEEHTSELQSR
jgi:hypothetical protein